VAASAAAVTWRLDVCLSVCLFAFLSVSAVSAC